MKNQHIALFLLIGSSSVIYLLTYTSSEFSALTTLFRSRADVPPKEEVGVASERCTHANFPDDYKFEVNRSLIAPSLDYEKIRRRTERGVEEMWTYISSQIQHLQNITQDKNVSEKIDRILELGGEQHRSIMSDIYNISQVDGYSLWRQRKREELSKVVQRRLFYIQNPSNCSSAKKIVCDFKFKCGFGCQMHHLSTCMIMAYGTGRTLILHSKRMRGWPFKEGWEKFFLPLSKTCLDDVGITKGNWGDPGSERVQVLQVPFIGRLPEKARPNFLPLAIPEDISQELIKAHGNPAVWWIGQIMKFILRLQPDVEDYIYNKTVALKFDHPIVGIQVRRTDKLIREAEFHGIEEYMVHAENFYKRLEMRQKVHVRRIYLATDEIGLLEEAKKRYPLYEFVSDNGITEAAQPSLRSTDSSLKGFLTDLHHLSRSDFLICTFSANVGRLAYELMQDRYEDASDKAFSVDKGYYHKSEQGHELTALYEHKPRSNEEIELRPGDRVFLLHKLEDNRNLARGYSAGINRSLRSKPRGLFPTYKVKEKFKIVKMPTYPEATDFNYQ